MTSYFASSVLASLLLIPLLLWAGGRGPKKLFELSKGFLRPLHIVVLAVQVAAAIIGLVYAVEIAGIPIIIYAGVVWLSFLWLKTFLLFWSE